MENVAINWKPEMRKLVDLMDWEKNPRNITPEAMEELRENILKRGFHDIVKIDTNGVILSGTQRKKALLEIGVDEVWAFVPDRELTEEEREKVALESNMHKGGWDWKILKGFDVPTLLDVGFTEDDLRINFGLNTAGDVDLSDDRMMILAVVPPETSFLKERAVIKFKSIEDYQMVKSAVVSGKLTPESIIKLLGEIS